MEIIDVIKNVVKISYMNCLTYIVFIKLINYTKNDCKKTGIIIAVSIIEAFIEIMIFQYIAIPIRICIIYFIHSLIISKITGNKVYYSIIITFISLAISSLVYDVSILISAIILKIIYSNIQINNILILIGAIIIEYIILHYLFKMKRFRKGVAFLKHEEKTNNIGIIGFAFIGIAILLYSLLSNSIGRMVFNTYLFTGIIIELICLTIWIRRKITKYYKQKMKEKTIQELENELNKKDEEISKILEENKEIAIINHKYSSRIKALEEVSIKILSKPEVLEKMKAEFGEEFGELQTQINKLSEEYSNELKDKIKNTNELEKTGIFGIDNILEYMSNEATKNNIDFNLKINGNIKYMVENLIEESKLETLLGDHIKDAIIAINSSENEYKDILVEIGKSKDYYEVCIYDTGIEFEIDTLLKLGLEQVTTHKATGGSGIGFITTFETLNLTNASLIIEERHPINNTDYTKLIKIRFDGKCEYKICSYRAEEIISKLNDDRIIVEHL